MQKRQIKNKRKFFTHVKYLMLFTDSLKETFRVESDVNGYTLFYTR